MAERSDFWGGFWLGAIVGGITSAIVISRLNEQESAGDIKEAANPSDPSVKDDLQQKIAQLNSAIDAVSQEISAQETQTVPVQES